MRILLLVFVALASCKGPPESGEASPPAPEGEGLFRVGSIVVHEADPVHRLETRYDGRDDEETRQRALRELARRARFAQAAIDAGLAEDAFQRDDVARLLEARLRETKLAPSLRELQSIPEERLRELYEAERDRFQAPEQRQVAVLWLNPGLDPERAKNYAEKMAQAREFAVQNPEIRDHPDKGFSVLSADYSEHSASRFRGGVVGWMQDEGGSDEWSKAVAEITFGLEGVGEISEVTSRKEGVFLVRVMEIKPAVTRPFESVAPELERAERARLREELEKGFERAVEESHPIEWTS